MSSLHEKLLFIQQNLNAPKTEWNDYSRFMYRSCESILASVKPLLKEQQLILTMSDEVELHGNRVYIKATVTISDGENSFSVEAMAREPETRKGFDESQLTGSTSSYARKYALCGLFAIDDNKEVDTTQYNEPSKPQEDGNPNHKEYKVLIEAAQKSANLGLEEYKKFYQSRLSQEQRDIIGWNAHLSFKEMALAKSKGVGNATEN